VITRSLVTAAVLVLCPGAFARASESLVLHEATLPDAAGVPSNVFASTLNSKAWLSLDAHYLRRLSLPWLERRILVGADADLPVFLWGAAGRVDAFRFGVRAAAEPYRARWFALVVDLQSRVGVQESALNTSVGWDVQLTVAPSLAFERWSLSPFAGVRQGLATYVRHGQIVKDAFADRYPDGASGTSGPRNGWIAGGVTRVPFGLAAGVELGDRVSLHGSGGLVWSYSPLGVGMFDAMMLGQWPFFMELGIGWRV
jgi:hypothetical protein